jgi:putative transposase
VEDHIHILTHIHPTISVAGLVKDIKLATSQMIKNEKLFKGFNGWQKGYGAFTYSFSAKDTLIEYIKNQEIHHRKKTFVEELIEILNENGVEYDPKYLK